MPLDPGKVVTTDSTSNLMTEIVSRPELRTLSGISTTVTVQDQLNSLNGRVDSIEGGTTGNKIFYTLVNATPILWNYNNGCNTKIILNATRTLNITNDGDGDMGLLIVTQPSSGGPYKIVVPVGDVLQDGINMVGTTRTIDLPEMPNSVAILTYIKNSDTGPRYWTFGYYH